MDIEKPAEDAHEQDRDLVETDEDARPQRGELPFDGWRFKPSAPPDRI